MNEKAEDWIVKLGLEPHPEGGFYRENYRATEMIRQNALPERFSGDRVFSTAIYYLLQGHDFSAFHKIKSDEIWHFYAGTTLLVHILDQKGQHQQLRLGSCVARGDWPQGVVPQGVFFGAEVEDKNSYALVGCTVAPGFDFADFTMASRSSLIKDFPDHAKIIQKLTR